MLAEFGMRAEPTAGNHSQPSYSANLERMAEAPIRSYNCFTVDPALVQFLNGCAHHSRMD